MRTNHRQKEGYILGKSQASRAISQNFAMIVYVRLSRRLAGYSPKSYGQKEFRFSKDF